MNLPEGDENELLDQRDEIQRKIDEIDQQLKLLTTTEVVSTITCKQTAEVSEVSEVHKPQLANIQQAKKKERCWKCGSRGHTSSKCKEIPRRAAKRKNKVQPVSPASQHAANQHDQEMLEQELFQLIPQPPQNLPELTIEDFDEVLQLLPDPELVEELEEEINNRPSWAEVMNIMY